MIVFAATFYVLGLLICCYLSYKAGVDEGELKQMRQANFDANFDDVYRRMNALEKKRK